MNIDPKRKSNELKYNFVANIPNDSITDEKQNEFLKDFKNTWDLYITNKNLYQQLKDEYDYQCKVCIFPDELEGYYHLVYNKKAEWDDNYIKLSSMFNSSFILRLYLYHKQEVDYHDDNSTDAHDDFKILSLSILKKTSIILSQIDKKENLDYKDKSSLNTHINILSYIEKIIATLITTVNTTNHQIVNPKNHPSYAHNLRRLATLIKNDTCVFKYNKKFLLKNINKHLSKYNKKSPIICPENQSFDLYLFIKTLEAMVDSIGNYYLE